MGIQASGGRLVEALNYNNVYLRHLSIDQNHIKNSGENPIYAIKVAYQLYAVDSSGTVIYDNKLRTIKIPDYLPLAMEKAAIGDTDLLVAIQSIEVALSKLIEEFGDVGTTSLV